MSLFKRKTRATRRAEARAIRAKAKLEAKLAAKNEARRIKAAHRTETKALKAQLKAQRGSDKAALKVAETQLKAAHESKLFSPHSNSARAHRVPAARTDRGATFLPRRHRRTRLRRRTAGRSARRPAQPDRSVLRAWRHAVGADRRRRALVAAGCREEAEGRRDQAVRHRHHRAAA